MRPLSWPVRVVCSFSFLLVPLHAAAAQAAREQANPGMLNYVEGQAAIGTQPLDSKSAGSAELKPGETLTTEKGKVEILLTPGVFLRLDENSAVQMVSPDLTDTEVRLEQGRATVEVAELHAQNELRVDVGANTAQLLKTGYYQFDASKGEIWVYTGKAVVFDGDERVNLKGGRTLDLNSGGRLKAYKFDKKQFDEEELNRWSSLRSAYVAEANQDAAADYETSSSWSDGWYWDPWFDCFTFIPGNGIFYSPFGWGFYSPWWAYGAPFYNYGHYRRHFDANFHNWGAGPHYGYGRPWARPGAPGGWGGTRGFARSQGGFRGGGSGHFGGGGFHGGGGGHGGGGHP